MYPELAVRQQAYCTSTISYLRDYEGFEGLTGSDVYGTREKRREGLVWLIVSQVYGHLNIQPANACGRI